MGGKGVLWECYGSAMGIRPRFEADLSYIFPKLCIKINLPITG